MSYYDRVRAEHYSPLPSIGKNLHDSTSDDDSEIEVTSVFDPKEHELIQMSEYLLVHSDDDVSDEERKQDQFSHRLAKAAWLRTLQSRDFVAAFHEIGYTWRDNTTVCLRTLPGFRVDPSVTDSGLVSSSEDEDERKIEGDADRASDARMSTQDQGRVKQITLQQCWK